MSHRPAPPPAAALAAVLVAVPAAVGWAPAPPPDAPDPAAPAPADPAPAEREEAAPADADPDADLVPQRLLPLLHAPEVHRELGLSDDRVEQLEALFREIDGPWFRSRNLPVARRRAVIAGLEARVHRWLAENASDAQRERLRQLEYQAQGGRALLRDDPDRPLDLGESRRRRLTDLARRADAALNRVQAARTGGGGEGEVDRLQAAATAAVAAERAGLDEALTPAQRRALLAAVGEPFDVAALDRIYPLAPEFGPAGRWLNSDPLTLAGLRGKVVLVHFYAFECHNCHANFGHYRRWHERYGDDVAVIGVQTPETRRERDPAAVRAAAAARGLDFPILVDLDSEAWDAWANTMWPTVYVVDRDGYVRYWWQGELNWQGATGDATIETLVDRLLKDAPANGDPARG